MLSRAPLNVPARLSRAVERLGAWAGRRRLDPRTYYVLLVVACVLLTIGPPLRDLAVRVLDARLQLHSRDQPVHGAGHARHRCPCRTRLRSGDAATGRHEAKSFSPASSELCSSASSPPSLLNRHHSAWRSRKPISGSPDNPNRLSSRAPGFCERAVSDGLHAALDGALAEDGAWLQRVRASGPHAALCQAQRLSQRAEPGASAGIRRHATPSSISTCIRRRSGQPSSRSSTPSRHG